MTAPGTPAALLDAALAYAKRGFAVHPLRPRDKRPATAHGLHDATTDPETLRRWWADTPEANIGLAVPPGYCVLDVDGDTGRASLNGHHLPETPCGMTGGGGLHYWFAVPEGVPATNRVGILPGIDLRAAGGYVVAPPSVHPTGALYSWADGLGLGEVKIAPAPAWLVALIAPPAEPTPDRTPAPERTATASTPYGIAALAAEAEAVASTAPGGRNDRLNLAALRLGQLVAGGELVEAEVRDVLRGAAELCGLTADDGERATLATIDSGLAAGKREPRSAPGREDEAKATAAVEELIATVRADPDPAVVFEPDALAALAALPSDQLADARARLKAALGDALNLNDLGSAVATARKTAAPEGAVVVGRQLADVTADALALLVAANDPPVLFRRSGEVVRVTRDEKDRPVIGPATPEVVRHRLAALAPWVRQGDKGPRPVDPPESVVRNLLASWELPFPALEAVVEAPVLRPDGTVLDAEGYDPATRLFYAPAPDLSVPPVPPKPTAAQVATARDLLLDELLGDFPFADEASRAGALALLLTPVLRPALRGCVPLALVDSPSAGTGKTLLTSVIATVATGRSAALLPSPRDDAEVEKRVFSLLAEGATFIVLDNIEGDLAAPSLAVALTATTFAGRVLGESRTLALPQRATWALTGNNITLRGDLPRRCYWVRLDAECVQPWRRTDFRHRDLLGWAADHRGELLAALLTLARAWWAAGKPRPDAAPFGSFERWAEAVGGILQLADVPGFLGNLDALHEQADEDAGEWARFLAAWAEAFGREAVTAADVIASARNLPELAEAAPEACRGTDGQLSARRLGHALAKRRNVRHGEEALRVVRAGEAHRALLWRVETGR